ncbi:MAG TPA: SurA N-terminal domain-containing protein [Thermoanaerobaculia bacterium]|nr:SurA N-terminal domain-containing protein [Thermoanaerobaculia bacterium]
MLKALRENFKHLQWILWAVIAVFVIFVFADWGMGSQRAGAGDTALAAKAGDIRITTAEFQKEYAFAEDRYRQAYGKNFSPELARAMNLPEQVLNSLIDRRLFREEAQRLHLKVTDDELTQHILGLKDPQSGKALFLKDGVFVGDAAYARILAANHFVAQGFEEQQREQILLEKLNRFFTEAVVVSDDDVKSEFEKRNVKAKIAWALLPVVSAAQAPATDAEAEAYFKTNPTAYMQPEKRKAKYLLVETAKIRPTMQVSDADVAAEYAANAESYRKGEEVHARHILYKADAASDAAQKAKAEAAVRRLKGGADFAALAKAESDDAGSKTSGGDLGAFPKGRMVKEFDEAAFGAKEKEIVGPVKTSFGYHVIQVLQKTGERVQPIFEVSAAIRARLQEDRARDEAKRLAAGLTAKVAKMGKPSDDDLRKLAGGGVTFNETEVLSRTDAPAGVGFNPQFSEKLFSLKEGETAAAPVTTTRGEALVKLVEIQKPGLPAFAAVKARVASDIQKKRQDEATLASLRQAMAADATLEGVAKKLNLKLETPEAFPKGGPIPGLGAPKAVLDAVFAAKPGELKGPIAVAERGAVVLRVDSVSPFDPAAFEKEKDALREGLRGQKSNRLLQALVQKRRSDLKVEFNRELLSRMGGSKA